MTLFFICTWNCAVQGYGHFFFYFQVQPTRCNVTLLIYFCEMLYMFQADSPPIIRSSKLYIQHRVLCQILLLPATTVAGSSKGLTKYPMLYIQFWAPDDGRRNRLKYVERFTEINKLRNFVLICFQRDETLQSLFISGILLYMFRVVSSPIIRSTYNCIYSIWYLLTVRDKNKLLVICI